MNFIKKIVVAAVPLVAMVALAACTKDDSTASGDNNGGGYNEAFELQMELVKAKDNLLEIKCTPNDDTVPYIVLATKPDANKADEELIANQLLFQARLAQSHKDMEKYVESLQNKGGQTVTVGDLDEETAYTVYAYANNTRGEVNGKIFKIDAQTKKKSPFDFTVTDITDMSAMITLTPLDTQALYFYDIVKKHDYDEWGGDEKTIEYNVDLMDQAIYILAMGGYDISYSYFLIKGELSGKSTNLVPDTDYVIFAFGMDKNGKVTTELARADFKTTPFAATDNCTFALSTADVTAVSMTVNVEPSSTETRYLVGITPQSETAKKSLDEIATEFISEIANLNKQNGLTWENTPYVVSGAQSLASKADLGYDENTFTGGREYLVMVFGIDKEGRRTTVPTTTVQRMAQAAQSNMTFNIAVHSISVNGAKVQFTPTSQEETFFTDVMTKEEYDSYGSDQALIDYIVNTLGDNITAYLATGNHEVDATNYLVSDTEYVAYCFGYDKGATTKIFSKEFKTEKLVTGSDAAVALQYVIENGDIYEDLYPQYKGKPVVTLIMTPNQHAKKWYCAPTTDKGVSSMSESDLTQWAMTSPYTNYKQMGYVGEWDTTLYVVTLALDGNGTAGKPECYAIELKKEQTETQSSVPALSSVARFAKPAVKAKKSVLPSGLRRNADKDEAEKPAQRLIDKFRK